MKETIGELIDKKRKKAGLTGTALAIKAGIPAKTIRKLQDGTTTDPRYKTLVAIAKALDCTLSELIEEIPSSEFMEQVSSRLFYKQWMALTPENQEVVVDMIKTLTAVEERLKKDREIIVETKIPVFTNSVSAGVGNFLDESNPVEYVTFDEKSVPSMTDYGVRVAGDSMEPAFFNGDIAFVQSSQRVVNGDIVVATINGESYIKQFRNGNFFSFNANYDPIVPNEYDRVQIAGIVVGVSRTQE